MDVPIRFFGNTKSLSCILIVGGSGDSKDSYDELVEKITALVPEQMIVTFSFRGVEEHKDMPLHQQIQDLKDVLFQMKKSNIPSVKVVATSNGAYSTAYLLTDPEWTGYIQSVLLLDPADHYCNTSETVKSSRTWTGIDSYSPTRKTTASLMSEITSNVMVHVVNFTLRNYGADGYADPAMRGHDNPQMYARLNNEMVHKFYTNTPPKNRGQYIEDATLPHAFMRDGDKNRKTWTRYSRFSKEPSFHNIKTAVSPAGPTGCRAHFSDR